MGPRRELAAFAAVLAALVAGFFGESLFGGKVLSPADVLLASVSFGGRSGPGYEPANRLLMDPVLQFQPWLEFNRAMLRRGRLPLWNSHVGCGAPHLANGQSAVFDPFHAIAYLGRLPEAHAWMAWARLWVAGLGMFLLARAWGLGAWGRWFAGLAFPFSGFLVVWLLYPVAGVAIWMPWLMLSGDRLLRRPGPRTVGGLALVAGLVLLGGHIQTGAHVLLAAALDLVWQRLRPARPGPSAEPGESPVRRALPAWGCGLALGIALGAVAVVPLGCYLARSPVWSDRAAERVPAWRWGRPRPLDAVCTALPYAFGSQRRGHPNLAKALGVHNLNESAGGFAGLATLVWLAPLAWSARRRHPRAAFLAGLAGFGAMGAFGLPPVDNLLRALPVLDVTDNRRLTLWVAFGLVLLGGIGLDELAASRPDRAGGRRSIAWAAAAIGLLAAAAAVASAEPWLRAKARAHYAGAAAEAPGADPDVYRARADRQVRLAVSFTPGYLSWSAGHLLALAALAEALRRGRVGPTVARAGLLAATLLDLFGFGCGLNPAISPAQDRPTGPVIAYLRREVGGSARVLGLGAELPPNTLMRHGLADPRNYDSVELRRSLAWFSPLYEPGPSALTSRREVTWAGVIRARDRLRAARVAAVVGPAPPPPGAFDRVDRAGDVWIARLPVTGPIDAEGGRARATVRNEPGEIDIDMISEGNLKIVIAETFDPGWRASVDGREVAIAPHLATFMAIQVAPGAHAIRLRYDPVEVRIALAISLSALATTLVLVAIPGPIRPKNGAIGLDGPNRSGYNRWRDLHRPLGPVSHCRMRR